MEDPSLSIVVPFRDEAASLGLLYEELAAAVEVIGRPAEMLFVDDESRDEGRSVVLERAAADPRVRLLCLTPQAGQSAALEAGFRAARGEVVATLDADLQNDPGDLPRLLAILETQGVDCVTGVRSRRCDPWRKRLASRLANTVRRRVLGDGLHDIGCSLRVMRAEPLARVKLFRGAHRFLPVLLQLEGARVVELPVHHRARRFGASKYGIRRRLGASALDLLGVLWLRSRTTRCEVKELSRRA
jgi:glycosyltransferase involved in cell wall biosynthesis